MKVSVETISLIIPPPKQARSQGVHVSNIIRCIATETGILKPEWCEELSLIEVKPSMRFLDPVVALRISMGLAWEDYYIKQVLEPEGVIDHPGEYCCDGIYMSPDGEELASVIVDRRVKHLMRIHEVKCTYKSTNTVGETEGELQSQFMWLSQIKAYCVSPETRIITDDLLWIPAKDIQVGDKVLSFTESSIGNSRDWKRATVESVTDLILPCYKIIFDDGTEVICSEDHRWLTVSSGSSKAPLWTRTDELINKAGRLDRRVCKPLNTWNPPSTYEQGWLAGMADGEGWVSQSKEGWIQAGLAQKEGIVANLIRKYLTAEGIPYREYDRQQDDCLRFVFPQHQGVIEFLGKLQPKRLLSKWKGFHSLPQIHMGSKSVGIKSCKFIGPHTVRAIETTSGTYIAEGFASHNCKGANTTIADLHVLFVCGNYGYPIQPLKKRFHLEFEQWEIDDNWEMLKAYKEQRLLIEGKNNNVVRGKF